MVDDGQSKTEFHDFDIYIYILLLKTIPLTFLCNYRHFSDGEGRRIGTNIQRIGKIVRARNIRIGRRKRTRVLAGARKKLRELTERVFIAADKAGHAGRLLGRSVNQRKEVTFYLRAITPPTNRSLCSPLSWTLIPPPFRLLPSPLQPTHIRAVTTSQPSRTFFFFFYASLCRGRGRNH